MFSVIKFYKLALKVNPVLTALHFAYTTSHRLDACFVLYSNQNQSYRKESDVSVQFHPSICFSSSKLVSEPPHCIYRLYPGPRSRLYQNLILPRLLFPFHKFYKEMRYSCGIHVASKMLFIACFVNIDNDGIQFLCSKC